MKVAFKSLTAAAAFFVACGASANTLTVPAGGQFNGLVLTGTQTYNATPFLVAVANLLKATVEATAPGEVQTAITVNPDTNVTRFTAIASKSPVGSFEIDTGTAELQTVTGQGGLKFTTVKNPANTGGELSLSDFKVDLLNKRVYATVVGGNGVGTYTNYYLWDADTVAGSTAITPPASGTNVSTIQASGLHFTLEAIDLIKKALGLNEVGLTALKQASAKGAGTIDTSIEGARQLTTCTAIYSTTRVRNSSLYDNQITLRNLTSSPATGWNLNWTYEAPTLTLSVKNAKLTQQQFTSYQAQPVAANTTVAADGATTVTFRSISTSKAAPTITGLSATLGGQTCAVSAQ